MALFNLVPIPKPLKAPANVFDLKERLDWGEPALTIIDIRDRDAFNTSRIMGAISMPADTLVASVSANLETERDIYIYANTDDEAAESAQALRAAGYQKVAELTGGLAAWKAANGPVEGSLPTAV